MITKCKYCGRELASTSTVCRRCKATSAPKKQRSLNAKVLNVVFFAASILLGAVRLFSTLKIHEPYSLLFATKSMSFAAGWFHLCIATFFFVCGWYMLQGSRYARKCMAATLAIDCLNTLFNSSLMYSTHLTAPERTMLHMGWFTALFVIEISLLSTLVFYVFFDEKKNEV